MTSECRSEGDDDAGAPLEQAGAWEGKDCSYALLGLIPLGTMNPTLDGALDDALAKVPTADALANATVTTDAYYFILWAQSCSRAFWMLERINMRPVLRGFKLEIEAC